MQSSQCNLRHPSSAHPTQAEQNQYDKGQRLKSQPGTQAFLQASQKILPHLGPVLPSRASASWLAAGLPWEASLAQASRDTVRAQFADGLHTVSHGFRRFDTVSHGFARFACISFILGFTQFRTVSHGFKRFRTVSDGFKRPGAGTSAKS